MLGKPCHPFRLIWKADVLKEKGRPAQVTSNDGQIRAEHTLQILTTRLLPSPWLREA
jgi:hypothetical protein